MEFPANPEFEDYPKLTKEFLEEQVNNWPDGSQDRPMEDPGGGSDGGGGGGEDEDEGMQKILANIRVMDKDDGETEYSWRKGWIHWQEEDPNGDAPESDHPWKVTGVDDDAVISPGFVFGIKAQGTNTSPWSWIPFEYTGETKNITADGYLYAEVNTTTETLNDELPGAGSGILSQVDRASGVTGAVVYSASAPSAYTGTAGYCYIPIAKVSLVAGAVVVDKQYLTHNPYVAIPDIYQD